MALIKTVGPDEGTGVIGEAYGMMKNLAGGMVPKPLQLLSASEKLFEVNWLGMQYYFSHPNLSPVLLAFIRFSAATSCEYPYCIEMNKQILVTMGGMSEEQAMKALEDPAAAGMSEKENAMLAFVQKAVSTPEDVQQDDVDKLRDLGWTDTDIYDATNHGASMVHMGIMFNAFKMGI